MTEPRSTNVGENAKVPNDKSKQEAVERLLRKADAPIWEQFAYDRGGERQTGENYVVHVSPTSDTPKG